MAETYKPSEKMITLYFIYLMIILLPILVIGIITTRAVYINTLDPMLTLIPALTCFGVPAAATIFVAYWAPKYYASLVYELTGDEVIVKKGVWWRMKHTVPYSRIMSVDIVQGPISRWLGHASVDVHTAGYTGQSGGTAGPGTRRAEASLIHVKNPEEIREKILSKVRQRPLFGGAETAAAEEMLKELRLIRESINRLVERTAK